MARRWIFGCITWSAQYPNSSIWKGTQQRLSGANKFWVRSLPAAYKKKKSQVCLCWQMSHGSMMNSAAEVRRTTSDTCFSALAQPSPKNRASEHPQTHLSMQNFWLYSPFALILHNSTDFIAWPWEEERRQVMRKKERGSWCFFHQKHYPEVKYFFINTEKRTEMKNKRKWFLTFLGSQTLVTYAKTFTTEIIFDSKNVFKTMFLHVLKNGCEHT